MKEKKPGVDLFPRPKRRIGLKRILVHMIIFAVLGALVLGGGLYGRAKLNQRAEGYKQSSRINALHQQGMAAIQNIMQQAAQGEGADKAINQGVTSKRRGLKNTITQQVGEGAEDVAILSNVAETLLTAVENRLTPEDMTLVKTAVAEHLEDASQDVSTALQESIQKLTLSQIRKDLPVTTPNYPFIYYSTALITAGIVLLVLAAILTYIWLRFDEDKKVAVAEFLEPMDYLLPFFVGVLIFTLYPVVRVVIMSFQERYKLDGSFAGWGFGNYEYVLKGIPGTSNYFIQGLGNTILFVLCMVPLSTVLAIVIAYLLNQKLRLSALFQTVYFLPMVTSVTAVGLVWRWIFNYNFGVLNALITFFGGQPINWLLAAGNSLAVLVIFGIWNTLPFTIILLLSGLQNIDDTYYTVARVDGAKALRIFRRITVPLLAPTIGLVLIINSISAFKVFTEVTVLFNGSPGPAYNMYTVVYYIYEMMHQKLELGRAAAAAIVLFLFIFAFTMLQRVIQRKWNYT